MSSDKEDDELTAQREIPQIESEIEAPPASSLFEANELAGLSAKDKIDLGKWLKNFNFIYFVLVLMVGVFLVDLITECFKPDIDISLLAPLFEVLKTLLLTVSGYIFAKSSDK